MRLFYEDLEIGQEVKVQVYFDRLTENFYTGEITNMDGQNIVVKVGFRDQNEPIIDGLRLKIRDYEACNPKAAIVEAA